MWGLVRDPNGLIGVGAGQGSDWIARCGGASGISSLSVSDLSASHQPGVSTISPLPSSACILRPVVICCCGWSLAAKARE